MKRSGSFITGFRMVPSECASSMHSRMSRKSRPYFTAMPRSSNASMMAAYIAASESAQSVAIQRVGRVDPVVARALVTDFSLVVEGAELVAVELAQAVVALPHPLEAVHLED